VVCGGRFSIDIIPLPGNTGGYENSAFHRALALSSPEGHFIARQRISSRAAQFHRA
jgi:hypothetical protein